MTGHPGEVHCRSWRMPVWGQRLSALGICAAAWGGCPVAGAEAGVAWLTALACPGDAPAAA
eukprot:5136482-Heterocapsa_arctica.AAC.1